MRNTNGLTLVCLTLATFISGPAAQKATADEAIEGRARSIMTAVVQAVADPAAAQEQLARVIAGDPASPLAGTAARLLLRCRAYSQDPSLGADLVRKILSRYRNLHGFAAQALHRAAAMDAAGRGETDAWNRHLQAIPRPRHFLVLGPLGDFADDQHGVPFPPERLGIDLDREEKGAYGPVRWRPLTRDLLEPRINPARRLKKDKGAYYTLLQVNSPTARTIWLQFSPQGSFQAWVNGTPVADMHGPAVDIPARMLVTTHLAAGWNRILVKTTDVDNATFGINLVDALGLPLTDLAEEQGRVLHPLPKDGQTEAREQSFRGPLALLAAAKGPWARLLSCQVLMDLWLSSAGLDQLTPFLDRLAEQPREWQAVYADRLLNAWHLPGDLRRNRARAILKGLAEGDDDTALYARLLLARLLLADDQGEKVIRELKEILAGRSDHYATLEILDQCYRKLGWHGEEMQLLARLRKLAPKRLTYISRLASRARRLGDRHRNYDLLKEAYAINQANLSLIRQLRRTATVMGRLDEAADWLERERVFSQEPADILETRANLAALAEDRPKAISLYEELARLEPDNHQWTLARARLLAPEAALAEYGRILAREPADQDLRKLVGALREQDWGAELAAWRADIPKVIADFKMKKSYLESSSILVVDHMVTRVFPDGSWINEIHQLRRINDQQGVDEHGEVNPQGELVNLRAWHPDGRISEPIEVEGSYEIPGLKPGCFIEELSRNTYTQPVRGIREVTDFWFSRFEEDFLWTRLIVIMPKNHRGEFRCGDRLPPPRIEEKGDTLVYTFDHRNMSRVHKESNMPSEPEVLPFTLFGEDRPADEINREMRERFLRSIKGSAEVARAVARACAGKEGDLARIKAIYDFVNQEIPSKPGSSNPTSILLKKEGERWFLTAAMLREAGIPMRFANIHPAAPGTDSEPEPLFQNAETLGSWYTLPALKLYPRDGSPLWLLAGMPRHLPLGMIPGELSGAPAMMLDRGGATIDFLPTVDATVRAQYLAKGEIKLRQDQGATARFTLTFPGLTGYRIKEMLSRSTQDRRERFISGQLVAFLFRGATLRGYTLPDLEKPAAPLRIRLMLEYGSFLRNEGGHPAAPLGIFTARLGRFIDRPTRSWPFVCREDQVLKWQVILDPGPHWVIKDYPPSQLVKQGFITWDLRFHSQGDRLEISRSMVLQPGRVPPEGYSRLITTCRAIDEAEGRSVILEKRD